jgi:hypothetical protein
LDYGSRLFDDECAGDSVSRSREYDPAAPQRTSLSQGCSDGRFDRSGIVGDSVTDRSMVGDIWAFGVRRSP